MKSCLFPSFNISNKFLLQHFHFSGEKRQHGVGAGIILVSSTMFHLSKDEGHIPGSRMKYRQHAKPNVVV